MRPILVIARTSPSKHPDVENFSSQHSKAVTEHLCNASRFQVSSTGAGTAQNGHLKDIVAVVMAAEVGDFSRFDNPRRLMAHPRHDP